MNTTGIDRTVYHWTFGWVGVIAFVLFGGAVLWISLPVAALPPDPREVSEATGQVDTVQNMRGGVYFSLRGPNISFVLHSKSGHLGLLQSTLTNSPAASFKVRYRNVEPTSPLFLTGRYYTVLAVSANDKTILSEQQILEGNAKDNLIGVAISVVFLIFGLGRAAWLAGQ